jgi:hypothetical protein
VAKRKTEPTAAEVARWEANRARVAARLTEPPILIGGCGRSGTTLLLSIVSAHRRVWAIGPETNVFCPCGYGPAPDLDAAIEIDPSFYQHFDGLGDGGEFDRWCEKTPRNILYFPRVMELFDGRVRLLQIIRDGRDVVLSRHPVDQSKYWVSIERWVRDVEAGVAMLDHPLVHTVRYEELIRDNERVVRGMCEFLGLEYGPAMVDWHKHATVRENPAWDGKVKPLFESSIGKWRKPEHAERVAELMSNERAVALLERLGYLDGEA